MTEQSTAPPAQAAESRSKRGLLIVTGVMVAVFGPYIGAGARTEQVAVYGAAVVLSVLTLPLWRAPKALALTMVAWSLMLAIALLSSIGAEGMNRSRWPLGQFLAGVDNLTLPVAVCGIVLSLVALGADPRRLLQRVALWAVLMMCVNTVATFMQMQGVSWAAWWDQSQSAQVTALRAEMNFRYSGLINQPAEAGTLYGLAVLAALYLWSDRPGRLLVASAFLVVGGVLTVSKIFLLIALPILVWELFRARGRRGVRLVLLALMALGLAAASMSGLLPEWKGAGHLRSLTGGGGGWGPVEALSAGRYGEGSMTAPVVAAAMDHDPLFGFGAAGVSVAYDSGFVEVMVLSGLFGLACFVVVLVALTSAWRAADASRERRLFGQVLLLLVGASFGLPAFTANRVATVAWLLIATLVLALGAESVDRVRRHRGRDRLTRRGLNQ